MHFDTLDAVDLSSGATNSARFGPEPKPTDLKARFVPF